MDWMKKQEISALPVLRYGFPSNKENSEQQSNDITKPHSIDSATIRYTAMRIQNRE